MATNQLVDLTGYALDDERIKLSPPPGTIPGPVSPPGTPPSTPPAPAVGPAPTASPNAPLAPVPIPQAASAPTFAAMTRAPASITPPPPRSMRELIPMPTPAPPSTAAPASATNQLPAGGVQTAPVVAAPVLSTVAENETVAGQLRSLLDANNPLLQQARTRAQTFLTGRGLQNSTMAGQAGEEAAIAAALPIAGADAATYGNRALINQETQNRFGLAEQGFQQQRTLNAESSAQRMAEAALAGDMNSRLQLEQAGYNLELSAADNLARMEQLALQGNINAGLALQQFNHQALLADMQQGHAIQLEDKRFQTQQSLLFADFAQRLHLSEVDQSQTIERMNRQHAQTLEQIAASAEAENSGSGPRLQAQYLASVSERMNFGSQEIAQIYQTQGLTAAQQQTAVANAYARIRADLDALQRYYQQSPLWAADWGAPTSPSPGGPVQPIPGTPVPSPGTPTGPGVQVPLPPTPSTPVPGSRWRDPSPPAPASPVPIYYLP